MPVKFNVIAKSDPRDLSQPKKYYASLKRSETIDLENMVDTISDYSTVNPPDVMAVLESLVRLIPKQLLQGRGVNFGRLGTFYLSATSDGSDTEEEVNEFNIRKVRLRFQPSRKLSRKFRDISYERSIS